MSTESPSDGPLEAGKDLPEADLGLEQFGSEPDDQGLSLDDLSSAYAEMMGGDDPFEAETETEAKQHETNSDIENLVLADDDEDECDAEMSDVSPISILEAMLFVGHPENEPLTSRQISSLMRGVRAAEIDDMIVELNEAYRSEGRPFEIVSQGAGYRMALRKDYAPLRNVFYGKVREARLSQTAIEVLSIVAYRQGHTKPEIEELRGKPTSAILAQMVRRDLLRIERPDKKPRKPCYYTTDRFLNLFGLDAIEDLPRSE